MSKYFQRHVFIGLIAMLSLTRLATTPIQASDRVALACATVPGDTEQYYETMDTQFSWSADGKELAFGRGLSKTHQIRLLNLKTKKQSCLTGGEHFDSEPTLSPDGKSVAFKSNRSGHFQIYIMNVENGDTSLLLAAPNNQHFPAYSPDGKYIAFVQEEDANDSERRTLRVVQVDGNGERILHHSPFGLNHLSWSFDGKEIYLFSIESGAYNDILVANVHDATIRKRTDNTITDSYSMARSPDHRLVSFSEGVEEDMYTKWFNYEMFLQDETAQNTERLTWAWGSDQNQAYSPDGKNIAFISNRTGYWEIYLMNANGTNLQQLTHQPQSELTAQFRRGHHQEAQDAFESMRAENEKAVPFSVRAAQVTFDILVARDDRQGAEALAEMFVAAHPDAARAYATRAFMHLQNGSTKKAMNDYRQAVSREGNEMHSFVQLGPERYFEMVSGIPDFWKNHAGEMNALAYQLLSAGEPRQAVSIFKKVLDTDPEHSGVTDSLAEAYMMYGDYESAVRYYRESLRLNPANDNAKFHLKRIENLVAE